ncbi:hypothetical protein Bhyg_06134 [Pseudolycoriella hygida]|uniref:THAP-type domain-containing protein n=1 Tax=Pseudolycoriella hygida TaxID=35572 RepID=A0A9Q0N220_9DIPT|nr:hypothetical protein Bhyg_06134 [Pseudolycoriella hygida]
MSYGNCVLNDCKTEKREVLTFHRIPKDPAIKDKWCSILGLPENTDGRVCSKHFNPIDFVTVGNGHVCLRHGAIPLTAQTAATELKESVSDIGIEIDLGEIEPIVPDTVFDMEMNCSLFPIYRDCIYLEHNYSKFENIHRSIPRNIRTRREWMKYHREELHLVVKHRKILKNKLQ